MATLVIHAPSEKVQSEQKRSFESTVRLGVGDGYAIARDLRARITLGCRVVVLDKGGERRAEGTLVRLVATSKTGNGIQRYDVHMKDLKEVPYKPENLNRNGVAVI